MWRSTALTRSNTDSNLRKKADIPIYSFEKHARLDKTNTIYSPHVLVLEGIFALHDERVMDLLDLKIFTEADADLCLSRRRKYISIQNEGASLIFSSSAS